MQQEKDRITLEGYSAYQKSKCSYNWDNNPYKGSSVNWEAFWWQCGFQQGYAEDHPPKGVKEDTTYNFRNEGESSGQDRYFGRGL